MKRFALNEMMVVAGVLFASGLAGGCAIPAADPEARQLLLDRLGSTSFTVFPAFVRAEQDTAARRR